MKGRLRFAPQARGWEPFQPSRMKDPSAMLTLPVTTPAFIWSAVMHLYSPEFLTGTSIPDKYTCDGEDMSPPLTWDDPPANARSFALIVRDRDAPGGVFTHWVLYNLPADQRELPAGLPKQESLPEGIFQGKNGLRQSRLWWPLSPQRNPSLFLQALCPRYAARCCTGCQRARCPKRYAGPTP